MSEPQVRGLSEVVAASLVAVEEKEAANDVAGLKDALVEMPSYCDDCGSRLDDNDEHVFPAMHEDWEAEEEVETESVLVCQHCGEEDPSVSAWGNARFYASLDIYHDGPYFSENGWMEAEYEDEETETYSCSDCGHEETSLDDLLEVRDLPVDR